MSLTHKKRVQYTLQHYPTDRLSTQINYTAAMDEKMGSHLLDDATQKIADDHGQHFIVPNFGFCLFERAWSRGQF